MTSLEQATQRETGTGPAPDLDRLAKVTDKIRASVERVIEGKPEVARVALVVLLFQLFTGRRAIIDSATMGFAGLFSIEFGLSMLAKLVVALAGAYLAGQTAKTAKRAAVESVPAAKEG